MLEHALSICGSLRSERGTGVFSKRELKCTQKENTPELCNKSGHKTRFLFFAFFWKKMPISPNLYTCILKQNTENKQTFRLDWDDGSIFFHLDIIFRRVTTILEKSLHSQMA
jgi:hypothetical protein